jgi:hypothetical protein
MNRQDIQVVGFRKKRIDLGTFPIQNRSSDSCVHVWEWGFTKSESVKRAFLCFKNFHYIPERKEGRIVS